MLGIALDRIRYDPQLKVNQQHDYEMRRSYRSNTGSSCKKRVQVELCSESKNGEVRDHAEADIPEDVQEFVIPAFQRSTGPAAGLGPSDIPEEEWCEQTDTNESRA